METLIDVYCCSFIVHFNKKFHIYLSLVDNHCATMPAIGDPEHYRKKKKKSYENFQHKTIQYFRIVLIDF